MAEFAEWESFYVIVGSTAGTLIGLQFAVTTLIAERPLLRAAARRRRLYRRRLSIRRGLAAVSDSPRSLANNYSHCYALGLYRHQWRGVRRARSTPHATPNNISARFRGLVVSCSAASSGCAILAVSALAALFRTLEALFGVATATLLLLFIGIHNAWDTASYHVLVNALDRDTEPR
jgi:hypothetical protein